MRVAADQSKAQARFPEKLGRHQSQEVRTSGRAKPRGPGKRKFRSHSAPDDLVRFEDGYRQALPCQDDRGDQAIVPGADDDDIWRSRHDLSADRTWRQPSYSTVQRYTLVPSTVSVFSGGQSAPIENA